MVVAGERRENLAEVFGTRRALKIQFKYQLVSLGTKLRQTDELSKRNDSA
jgi:hypothetical protein